MRPWALALVPVLALLPPGSRTAVSPCCESGDLDAFNETHWQCLGPDNATGPVRIDCRPEDVQVVLMAMDLFEITPEGHLDMYSDNLYINRIEMSEYCRGNVSEGLVASGYGNSTHREAAAVCETGDPARKLVSEEYIGYCMILSAVFFAITGVVYIAVPDLRDLQGKSIINLCLCLTVGLSVLAAMKIMESYDNMDLCAARGMFVYFFIIAGFFWMNSIAVQFLMSIRWSSRARGGGWRPFVWFALYSWGGAAALASLVALVNFNAGRHPKPGIGLNHCWFISSKQQWIYMYSVMTVLMLLNLAIFVYASVLLWRHSFRSTHLSELKYKFTMTSRLYVLLGLPWIFEMIVSSAPKYYLLEVLDLFTALQGVLVFVVLVVSRRRARAGLRALLPALCPACCAPPDGAERQPDRLDAPDQTALFLSMTNYKNDCAGDGDGDEDARARN